MPNYRADILNPNNPNYCGNKLRAKYLRKTTLPKNRIKNWCYSPRNNSTEASYDYSDINRGEIKIYKIQFISEHDQKLFFEEYSDQFCTITQKENYFILVGPEVVVNLYRKYFIQL